MKLQIILAILARLTALFTVPSYKMKAAAEPSKTLNIPSEIYDLFDDWKRQFNHDFETEAEANYRIQIFYQNFLNVKQLFLNKNLTFVVDFTKFMIYTQQEFKTMLLSYNISMDNFGLKDYQPIQSTLQKEIEYQLSPARDTGSCGSAWAVAALTSFEYINKNQILSLQQIIDCQTQDNFGCAGGSVTQAISYIAQNGLSWNSTYPDSDNKQSCKQKTANPQQFLSQDIQDNNCQSLISALQQGPVITFIDGINLQFYSKGLFNDCGTEQNLPVVVKGYDSEGNLIVQNSWGSDWGIEGDFKILQSKDCGQCRRFIQLLK